MEVWIRIKPEEETKMLLQKFYSVAIFFNRNIKNFKNSEIVNFGRFI